MIRHYRGTLGFIFLFLGFINTVEAAATATADPDAAAGAPGRTVSAAGEEAAAPTGPYQALMKAFMAQWVEKHKPADPDPSAGAAAALTVAELKTPTPAEAEAYAARIADVMAANPRISCEELAVLLRQNPYLPLIYQWSKEELSIRTSEGFKELRVPINLQASVANTILALYSVIYLARDNMSKIDAKLKSGATDLLPSVSLRDVFKPGEKSTDVTCKKAVSIRYVNPSTGRMETKDKEVEVVDEEVLKGIITGLTPSLSVLNAEASVLENMKALWATFKEMVAFYTETRLTLASKLSADAGGGAGASSGKVGPAKPAGGAGSMPPAERPAGDSGVAASGFMDVPLEEGSPVLTPGAAAARDELKKLPIGKLIEFLGIDKIREGSSFFLLPAKKDGLPSLPGLPNTWEEAKSLLVSSKEDTSSNFRNLGGHILVLLDAYAEVVLRQKDPSNRDVLPKFELASPLLPKKDSWRSEEAERQWLGNFACSVPIFNLEKGMDFNMEAAYWGLRFLVQQYEAKYEEYLQWRAASPEDLVWNF